MGIFAKKPDIDGMLEAKDVVGLIEALRHKNNSIREKAAQALGKLNNPRAVDPLIQTLKDYDESVRQKAAEALGEIKDPRAIEPLTIMVKGNSLFDQLAAGIALEKITGRKTQFILKR